MKTKIIMITILAIGLSCCTGTKVKLTDFQFCMNSINKSNGSWSIFGNIIIPKNDSATIAECSKIHKASFRLSLVEQFCIDNLNGIDSEMSDDCKLKLQFIMTGIPKKVSW